MPATRCASRSAELLVLIGTCTHLGCLPKQRFGAGELYAGWPGGFFLPVPRVAVRSRRPGVRRLGRASANLKVPPYSYPNARARW